MALGIVNVTENGITPIERGGTGKTTAGEALQALGGFSEKGGTISGDVIMQGNLNMKNTENNNKISFQTSNYIMMNANNQMEIKASALNFLVTGTVTHRGIELAKANFANVTKETIESKLTCKGGYSNIAIGGNALKENSKGSNNTAVGDSVLENNTEGSYNTGVGADALRANTIGDQNAALGHFSMKSNTTGEGNTALGTYALQANTTGTHNTAVGFLALYESVNYNNCSGLGYGSEVTGSNQVQLGESSVTVYAQKAIVTRSDARDKIDIEDSPLGLNFILKLRPCKYRMNSREAYFEPGQKRDFSATNDGSKAGKRPHYGLIAQEVKEAMNELNVDFAGYLDSKVDGGEDVLSLGYTEFIAPMIKAIQEQQNMIEELQKQIEELKK